MNSTGNKCPQLLMTLVILVSVVSILSCGGDKKSKPNAPNPITSTYKVSLDPTNPLLAKAINSDNSVVDFYGAKDTAGQATEMNLIIVKKGAAETIIEYGNENLPKKVTAPNGVQLAFEWSSPTHAVLTGVSVDGTYQISTEINLDSSSTTPVVSLPEGTFGRVDKPVTGREINPSQINRGEISNHLQSSAAGLVNIQLTRCGVGIEDLNDVLLIVEDATPDSGSDGFLGQYPAIHLGNGLYGAAIPTGVNTSIVAGVCSSVALALQFACDWTALSPDATDQICAAIATAMTETGVPNTVAAEFGASCVATSDAFGLICQIIGSPSLADKICEAEALDVDFTGDVVLSARVYSAHPPVYTPEVTAPSNGPYPQLYANLGAAAAIQILTLEPAAPVPFMPYTATAELYCLPAGTVVTLHIQGSDNYTNQISYNVNVDTPHIVYQLLVPGAETVGVQDVVTVIVTLPGEAGELRRTASLVFGTTPG